MRRSVEAADDTADQIAVVERPEVECGAVRHRLEPGQHFAEPALGIPAERLRRLDRDRGKAQWVAGAPPPDNCQVGRDDRGDLG